MWRDVALNCGIILTPTNQDTHCYSMLGRVYKLLAHFYSNLRKTSHIEAQNLRTDFVLKSGEYTNYMVTQFTDEFLVIQKLFLLGEV